jgi:hypothetical protein
MDDTPGRVRQDPDVVTGRSAETTAVTPSAMAATLTSGLVKSATRLKRRASRWQRRSTRSRKN